MSTASPPMSPGVKPREAATKQGMQFGAHLGGSATAAVVNFPLWKAAAIGQSGFKEAADFRGRMRLIFGPPYKGVAATIFGMTWARAAIFYGSDTGKDLLLREGYSSAVASTVPPVSVSAFVQVVNQPIVRSTIMLQDPSSTQTTVVGQLFHLSRTRGWRALYHGSSASVLKTVPKYVCAIWVKDWVASRLPPPTAPDGTAEHRTQVLNRSAAKSVAAGVAGAALEAPPTHPDPHLSPAEPDVVPPLRMLSGAALTNPLDVIRNEMFKFEESFGQTVARLVRTEGCAIAVLMRRRSSHARASPHAELPFMRRCPRCVGPARKLLTLICPVVLFAGWLSAGAACNAT